VDGDVLEPGDVPFEITGLESVWVLADARQSDLSRVVAGQPATFTVEAFPDRTWNGRVAVVEPVVDAGSRTTRVHVHLDNPDGVLLPDMFGRVTLSTENRSVLTVPVDALLPSGTRDVVFVALGEGRFAPRAVTVGVAQGDRVEIRDGLTEGEQVVTRANFLVDSESSLRSALAAME
jgi:Cu(I)/Ag(I) efflux system membrane fusion protein